MERIEKLKSMLLQSPEDCFVYHALGLEYVKLNDFENAVDYFNQVIFIDESYVGTYYHLAKTLEKLNEIEEAISMNQILISLVDHQLAGFLYFESSGQSSILRYWFVNPDEGQSWKCKQ
jgi:tetratricopeptide (TPR) repeat protein